MVNFLLKVRGTAYFVGDFLGLVGHFIEFVGGASRVWSEDLVGDSAEFVGCSTRVVGIL